jgi:hypothetical protein
MTKRDKGFMAASGKKPCHEEIIAWLRRRRLV